MALFDHRWRVARGVSGPEHSTRRSNSKLALELARRATNRGPKPKRLFWQFGVNENARVDVWLPEPGKATSHTLLHERKTNVPKKQKRRRTTSRSTPSLS